MMNAIPYKVHGCLASPFLLVHGVGYDKCTWIPLFFLLLSLQQGWSREVLQAPRQYVGRHCGWQVSYLQCAIGLQSPLQEILQAG